MLLSEFISKLKLAHDVPNYYNNHFPKNLGYYDGSRFSFDCWNLIKAVLSGWTDNRTPGYYIHTDQLVTGDIDGYTMLKKCSGRSKDFTKLRQPGTYLYIYKSPHAGIYLGDFEVDGYWFNVVECTGTWASKVQYTYVDEKGGRYLYKGGANYLVVNTGSNNYEEIQIEKGSTATPYEPYNGYQVTVNLGGTYYSGTLDVVTGVFVPDTAEKDLSTLTFRSASRNRWLSEGIISEVKHPSSSTLKIKFWSDSYYYTDAQNLYDDQTLIGIAVDNDGNILCRNGDNVNTPTGYIVYELATPTPIQLSPTMVKALVGENHLSAPLDGQEITESKYRELFTWDEVEEVAQKLATSAVADLRCYQSQDGAYGMLAYVDSGTVFYDWVAASPSVKLLSTISVMPPLDEIEFTDSSIYSSSICELIVVGDSDVPVVTHVKVTSGKVVFTLSEALDSTIRCACKVTNSILY